MELRDYLAVLRRYWVSIVAVTLAGLVVGLVSASFGAGTATARSDVFISVQSGEMARDVAGGAVFASSQIPSYAAIATSSLVLQPVIDELNLGMTPTELAETLDVRGSTGSMIITIKATETDPLLAAKIAEAVAGQLVEAVGELSPRDSDGNRVVAASVVGPAEVAVSEAKLSGSAVRLGLVVGFVLGLAQMIVRMLLDRSITGTKQVERMVGKAVLSTVPFADHPMASSELDVYRRLRINLDALVPPQPAGGRVLVVTSAVGGEGKTTVATNLATACAAMGRSVLLVDANLHRPKVVDLLSLQHEPALISVLTTQVPLREAAQAVGSGDLQVLGAGVAPDEPADILSSAAMPQFLGEAARSYDYVVVDAPAVTEASEAVDLAALASGAILVVDLSTAAADSVEEASNMLALAGADTLGMVLNHTSRR